MTSRVKSKESPGPTCPAFPNSEHFTSTHSPPLGQSLDRASGRPQKGFREALASLYSPNRIAQLRLRCLLRRGSQHPPPPKWSPPFRFLPNPSSILSKETFLRGTDPTLQLHGSPFPTEGSPNSSTCTNGPIQTAPSQPSSVPSYHDHPPHI